MALRPNERIRRQAAAWVASALGGDFDREAFEAWASRDSRRRAAFDDLWRVCGSDIVTAALQQTPRVVPSATDVGRRLTRRHAILGLSGAAVAACAAVVVLRPGTEAFETGAGQMRTLTLGDGSIVTLGASSRLAVSLGRARRMALERGEAFFDVTHDAKRPFVVTAAYGEAEVLGTRFALNLVEDHLELSVHEGRVRFGLNGDADAPVIGRNQRAMLKSDGSHTLSAFDSAVPDWRSGWLETEDMSLRRVVEELNRWSDRPIRIEDETVGARRVSGRFRLADPQGQVRNLAILYDLEVVDGGDFYRLQKPSSRGR